ncbi:hypothetical protein RDI58_016296 [Solanum bulbocastanum]|uniref:Uncharacterized protein n=1 Tax=Solanum bulbocastanum TaxID=147425 RepID=A0AAN8TLP1_SOLBU
MRSPHEGLLKWVFLHFDGSLIASALSKSKIEKLKKFEDLNKCGWVKAYAKYMKLQKYRRGSCLSVHIETNILCVKYVGPSGIFAQIKGPTSD